MTLFLSTVLETVSVVQRQNISMRFTGAHVITRHIATFPERTSFLPIESAACLFNVVSCCNLNSSQLGLWKVMKCDTVGRTAETLNVTQEEIERLNPGLMPWFITPGGLYTVPYNPVIQSPATWSTTQNCTPVLQIGYTECSQFRSTRTSGSLAEKNTQITTAKSTNKDGATKTSMSIIVTPATVSPAPSIMQTGSPLCYRDGKRANEEAVVMEFVADFACKAMINEKVTLQDEIDNRSILMAFGNEDDLHHYFSIRWTADCTSPQNVTHSCSQIMYKNWEVCK
ncbi:hypothetical protein M441DRAFT_48245 [Trichoderma asperellum CBS 433.97]|uniref:LysM domain-containing protein n=1 Tax=Trichoderma asperellum (strain ATCC 204424 / CBS 433.97 / NBRC 101777) TaxID=1042311 RepID=A0A2T3Z6I2_TRIA4|nr:hypothetical protein M441DRAFT_48245 [Trichoderma asperellum CBS 433.97]PTB40404.1 hypothetical protein M441DRAFT_48245 [Trichoderma asperellum CBS 433.97]